jgi:hypothetical protein
MIGGLSYTDEALVDVFCFSSVDRDTTVCSLVEGCCGLCRAELFSEDIIGDEPSRVSMPDMGGLLYMRDPMLRGSGEPPKPSAPDSGDMSGEVNMGGLSGFFTVRPDMGGL